MKRQNNTKPIKNRHFKGNRVAFAEGMASIFDLWPPEEPKKIDIARRVHQKLASIQKRTNPFHFPPHSVASSNNADLINAYIKLDPSFLDWFKERAAKVSALEESVARAEIEANLEKSHYRKRGQWIAFAIVLTFLAAGLLLIFTGHTTPGTILASAGTLTAALARLFIQGETSAQKKEPEEKKKPKKT